MAAAAAGGVDGGGAGRAQVVQELGTADIDARLEELLIDGILYAFQEQVSDDANVMLNGFGTVVNSLKGRAKPYLPQICGTIKWRLNNKARLASPPDSLPARRLARELPTRLQGCGCLDSDTWSCRQLHFKCSTEPHLAALDAIRVLRVCKFL